MSGNLSNAQHISTNNITKLNELNYKGVKLVFKKIKARRKNQNQDGKFD